MIDGRARVCPVSRTSTGVRIPELEPTKAKPMMPKYTETLGWAVVAACAAGVAGASLVACSSSDSTTPTASPDASGGSSGGTPATGSGGSSGANTGAPGPMSDANAGGGETGAGSGVGQDSGGPPSGDDGGGSAGDAGSESGSDGGPVFSGMPHVAVLYDPPNMNGVADLPRMLALLMAMPGIVVEKTDDHTKAPALASKQLIIIMGEAATFGGVVDPAIRDLPVPVILSKDNFAKTMQMGNDLATSADQNSIKIVKIDHPLAGGLPAGPVQVFPGTGAGDRVIGVSGLGPDAVMIATTMLSATEWSIYAYPKGGVMMNGFKAPAKRIGFFWHRPPDVTDNGATLFRAAVTWALLP
jgi:hypothetical protein